MGMRAPSTTASPTQTSSYGSAMSCWDSAANPSMRRQTAPVSGFLASASAAQVFHRCFMRESNDMADRLKVALFGLHWYHNTDPETIARQAQRAEEAGFEALWVGDHIALPAQGDDEPRLEA